MALAVSQGLWGALPGAFSTAQAPIHDDVMEVALSGGQVPATASASASGVPAEGAARRTVSDNAGDGDDGNGGGGGGGDGGGDGKRASLWLSLPFVAALLPGASPATRQQAAMSINIALKVCVRVVNDVLVRCGLSIEIGRFFWGGESGE